MQNCGVPPKAELIFTFCIVSLREIFMIIFNINKLALLGQEC